LISPLDLERLAVRIETLQQVSTRGWHPADELDFKARLPGSMGRLALPDPGELRELALEIRKQRVDPEQRQIIDTRRKDAVRHWRTWLSVALHNEGVARDNDPRNPKRIMRDISRGRFPSKSIDTAMAAAFVAAGIVKTRGGR